jgi:hypothetical protein
MYSLDTEWESGDIDSWSSENTAQLQECRRSAGRHCAVCVLQTYFSSYFVLRNSYASFIISRLLFNCSYLSLVHYLVILRVSHIIILNRHAVT